mmetsp:Transcript_2034/g.5157  ORF Transcript_2034/g.5157 Transcript_2034/m.5157 type:complete len:130 (-) Transcript_2034:910-1299(-)
MRAAMYSKQCTPINTRYKLPHKQKTSGTGESKSLHGIVFHKIASLDFRNCAPLRNDVLLVCSHEFSEELGQCTDFVTPVNMGMTSSRSTWRAPERQGDVSRCCNCMQQLHLPQETCTQKVPSGENLILC